MKEMLASKNELLLVFCFVMIISGCTAPSLSIEPHHLEMLVSLDGEEDEYYEEIALNCNGKRVDGNLVQWYSDNTEVAVVDQHGWVTSKGVGTALITAKYKGFSVGCTVEVKRKITSDTRISILEDGGVNPCENY